MKKYKKGCQSDHRAMPNRPREGGSKSNSMPSAKSGTAGGGSNHREMPKQPRG